MTTVHHRYATVNGRRVFYREAGPAGAPTVVLLHGFPASSFMFRHLIPRGALAFAQDAPGAEICLLDGGHFLLESHLDIAAGHIHGFLNRTLP